MNTLVADIEQKTAELVALCETHKELQAVRGQLPGVADSPINAMWVQAQNHYNEAARWAVNAAQALADKAPTA